MQQSKSNNIQKLTTDNELKCRNEISQEGPDKTPKKLK